MLGVVTFCLVLGGILAFLFEDRVPSPPQDVHRDPSAPLQSLPPPGDNPDLPLSPQSPEGGPTPLSLSPPGKQGIQTPPPVEQESAPPVTTVEVRPMVGLRPELPPGGQPALMPSVATPANVPVIESPLPVPEEESPSAPGGDLVITGRVLTDNGDPVPDLDVTASVNRLFESDAPGPGPPQTYQARTDHDGVFEFSQMFDGEYTLLTAPTPPYSSSSKRVRAGMEEVTLVVAEAQSQNVQGFVKQADTGAPVRGVTVAAALQSTTTNDAGRYELAVSLMGPGQSPIPLLFTHPDYREQQVTIPLQTRPTDQPVILKDVTLEAIQGRANVAGLVESEVGGKPLAGMRVFLSPVKGPGQKDALTGQDGTFRFQGVAWGTYTVVVVPKTGYQDLTYPNLQVSEAGIEALHLRLTQLPSSALTGHFVDPGGQPVRGLTLFLTSRTVRTYTGVPVTSDPSGYFAVQDVPAGEFELSTRSDPYLTLTGLTIQPGLPSPLSLPVDWGQQTLTGRVVTAGGLPVPGAEVNLSWSQTANGITSRSIRHSLADATGTFRFTQLGLGQHTLNVSAPGYTRKIMEHPVGPDQPTVQVALTARAS